MDAAARLVCVISDLHFEEEQSDRLLGEAATPPRNPSAHHVARFLLGLVAEAKGRGARRIDLVLAGDVFDLHRTQLWFDGAERPWLPSPTLATRAAGILDAIAAEPDVAAALRLFAAFAAGRCPADETPDAELRPIDAEVHLHYLPGNHDRLAGTLPALRARVRALLGLAGGDAPFAHTFPDPPGTLPFLVRHGHEYDATNFALTLEGAVPAHVADAGYDAPPLGDYMTVEVAARLPRLLREAYGESTLAHTPALRELYGATLAFDDLRPQALLLDFLLGADGADRAWAFAELAPVLIRVLDGLADDPFLRAQVARFDTPWQPDAADGAQLLLQTRPWRHRKLDELAVEVARMTPRTGLADPAGPAPWAMREELVTAGAVRLVVAGHTHAPGVWAGRSGDREVHFADCGTWRRVIQPTVGRRGYATLHARTSTWILLDARDQLVGFDNRTLTGMRI